MGVRVIPLGHLARAGLPQPELRTQAAFCAHAGHTSISRQGIVAQGAMIVEHRPREAASPIEQHLR